jgi:hypothetical protein
MSVCYELACHQCRKRLWVGQGSVIYTAPEHALSLSEFLHDHQNHPLEFVDDQRATDLGYERVAWLTENDVAQKWSL